ncbi:MAG TPA: hypothetical protein DCP37_06625, partial [Dehalococcoidia bacterium]|nr:hypothetical protein [Dehalococcoidia bacterium]
TQPPTTTTLASVKITDKIVFEDYPELANREILVMDPDGSNVQQLTESEQGSKMPRLSPDGRLIVYTHSLLQFSAPEIFVMKADGSNASRLTFNDTYENSPIWSPDSAKIAFADHEYIIHTMNADGSDITSTGQEGWPQSWHGDLIAFESTRDGDYEIFVMNSDGTSIRQLTHNSAVDHQPAFSPDGSRIAFTSTRYGDRDIFSMNTDGSGVWQLTFNSAWDWSPVWSPDGSRIAFASDRYTPAAIWDVFTMSSSGEDVIFTGHSGVPMGWGG